ncbi:unnamed protein product, partial [Leptidea sinapis]
MRTFTFKTDEDEESESSRVTLKDRRLIGRVPRTSSTNPGRGGGAAIVVRRNMSNLQAQQSTIKYEKETSYEKIGEETILL